MIRIDALPPDLRALVDRALRYDEPETSSLAMRELELAGWLLALDTDGYGNSRDAIIPLTQVEIAFAWKEFGDTVTAHRRMELRALLERHAGLRATCEGDPGEALGVATAGPLP